ncbi:hypothetical protein TELCIR_15390 [Teladorsagia circumcincta]|uniref:Uncharacterized protein n=1 Tax=Teladorsagia circumcincta TaxID=45464 RepID=A0A2G9TYM6_TELCI|nr:hypothetical protein TELCIR_15390 [Teladorsagia circumcincta]
MAADYRRNTETQLHKTEHRVTLTVTFIVTMFTLTNGPSALMHLIRTAYNLRQQELYDLTMICRIAIGESPEELYHSIYNWTTSKLSNEEK